ncbi:hypothetical protein RHSIM_Rhsim02G0033800 [Rhododendron simsii]|uniref:Pentatricopeptide repeat-containing protein n=1 Tax=Rhododendron simsii TaxID=118357 RepID=A0A834HCN4_RHOSS|nr:hypothetical protein RHSIM_Rhsim02G0033800 [Rhododendron simsii]
MAQIESSDLIQRFVRVLNDPESETAKTLMAIFKVAMARNQPIVEVPVNVNGNPGQNSGYANHAIEAPSSQVYNNPTFEPRPSPTRPADFYQPVPNTNGSNGVGSRCGNDQNGTIPIGFKVSPGFGTNQSQYVPPMAHYTSTTRTPELFVQLLIKNIRKREGFCIMWGDWGCWLRLDRLNAVVVNTGEGQKGGAGGYCFACERRKEKGDTERGSAALVEPVLCYQKLKYSFVKPRKLIKLMKILRFFEAGGDGDDHNDDENGEDYDGNAHPPGAALLMSSSISKINLLHGLVRKLSLLQSVPKVMVLTLAAWVAPGWLWAGAGGFDGGGSLSNSYPGGLRHMMFCAMKTQILLCKAAEAYKTSEGLKPDVKTYNAMIGGLCGRSLVDKAEKLLPLMEKDECPPNSFTCNVIVRAYLERGDKHKVMVVLQEMIKRCFSPNTRTMSMLMDSLKVDIGGCKMF